MGIDASQKTADGGAKDGGHGAHGLVNSQNTPLNRIGSAERDDGQAIRPAQRGAEDSSKNRYLKKGLLFGKEGQKEKAAENEQTCL